MPERHAQVVGLIDGAVLNLDHVGTILSNLIHQEESLEVLELDVPRALAAIKRARQSLADVNGALLLAAKQAEALISAKAATGGESDA